MATSGTFNFSVTAAQIITSALEDLTVLAAGTSPNANDLSTCLRTLNLLVKQWQGSSDKFPGLKIWTRQRLTMFFSLAQNRYVIGPAATDDRASAAALVTTLGSSKAASAVSITVASTSGLAAADQIGFVTTSGVLSWTTIASVDSGTTLTVASNSIAAASLGAIVFSYTAKAQRFVDIEAATLRDWTVPANPIDIPIKIYTDVTEYEKITQKTASGDPTAILVEPFRLNTVVTTNFAAANTYKALRLTVIYPSENYDSSTGADDIAYPQEYFAALEWELARRLAPKFGRAWTEVLAANWQIAVNEGVNLNPDDVHLCFEPGRDDMDVGSPFTRP